MFSKRNFFTRIICLLPLVVSFMILISCTNDNSDSEEELEYILPDEETGKDLSSNKAIKVKGEG